MEDSIRYQIPRYQAKVERYGLLNLI